MGVDGAVSITCQRKGKENEMGERGTNKLTVEAVKPTEEIK